MSSLGGGPTETQIRGRLMAKSKKEDGDRVVELLEKLLVLQMHSMGATQDQIARTVGRQKLWVNSLLRGVPREKHTP